MILDGNWWNSPIMKFGILGFMIILIAYFSVTSIYPERVFCFSKNASFVSQRAVPQNETKVMFDCWESYVTCSNNVTYHVGQNTLMTFQKAYFEINPNIPEGGFAITPHFGGGQ